MPRASLASGAIAGSARSPGPGRLACQPAPHHRWPPARPGSRAPARPGSRAPARPDGPRRTG